MTEIYNLEEAERVLAGYIPQVRELLGKDITLQRMTPLMKQLGNPERELTIVHVAGTSGKTSTSYYIAALLKAAGKKVGLTVSPHIDSITERVQINSSPITDQEFCSALGEFLDLIKDVNPQPTYFELIIAFAYWYFAREKVDYAVIETGLGGLHDATNLPVGEGKICVITDIGLDHQHVLGNSVEEISAQKAGIIQPHNCVFMHQQAQEVAQVIKQAAQKKHAILNTLSKSGEEQNTDLKSLPEFQKRNLALAKAVYDYVADRDHLPTLSAAQIMQTALTVVPARMDAIAINGKTLIMDGAHNAQKMQAFVKSFQKLYPNKKAAILLGLKEGKEYQSVLPLLKPISSQLIITSFTTLQDIPIKSISPKLLASAANVCGFDSVITEPNAEKAYQLLQGRSEDIVIITGSFYLLAQLRPFIFTKK